MPYKFILNKSLNWSLVDKDNSVIVESLTDEEKSKLEELIEQASKYVLYAEEEGALSNTILKQAAKDLKLDVTEEAIDKYFEDNY